MFWKPLSNYKIEFWSNNGEKDSLNQNQIIVISLNEILISVRFPIFMMMHFNISLPLEIGGYASQN